MDSHRRELPAGTYGFKDVEIGDQITTGSVKIDAARIDKFAALSGDSYGLHMRSKDAARHGFPDRIAHGLLVLSLVDGLKFQAGAQLEAQASLGWNWKFAAPVIVGDTVTAQVTIAGKRRIRDGKRGILTLRIEVRNQHGEVVQHGENRLMTYV
ncbi:MAG: MaoC/PaaZ C-terminal domain-containing protein [Rhodobacteraceae bacterium]|nr:MaoC/PaaZ C-terminal domain-containing protein [Paracoccaceae bacterium]